MENLLLDEHVKIGFYTASIYKWKNLLKPDKYKEVILGSLQYMVENNRATIYGFVIMPNHLHMLWKILPPWNSKEVQLDFMKYTSQMIKFDLIKNHPQVLERFHVDLKDRKYQFWQRNSMNKLLESREIVEQKLNYIHGNPVRGKWMLANDPLNYYYSSIRFYEREKDDFGFLSHYMEVYE